MQLGSSQRRVDTRITVSPEFSKQRTQLLEYAGRVFPYFVLALTTQQHSLHRRFQRLVFFLRRGNCGRCGGLVWDVRVHENVPEAAPHEKSSCTCADPFGFWRANENSCGGVSGVSAKIKSSGQGMGPWAQIFLASRFLFRVCKII